MTSERKAWRFTKEQYYKIAELGWFDGKHVELIDGEIIEMSPMGTLHATAVAIAARRLEAAFGKGYYARWQQPFDVGELTEPEPDVAIVVGNERDYMHAHPTTAALIVEVAETSLAYDRTDKASLYAKAGIQEYWIVNLADNQLEVHRHPAPMDDQPFGFGYTSVTVLRTGDTVSPLAVPNATIPVTELLP